MLNRMFLYAAALVFIGARQEGCASGRNPTHDISVNCGDTLGLLPQDAAPVDWRGNPAAWTGQKDGELLRISRRSSCGDECNRVVEIIFQGLGEPCPTLVSAVQTQFDRGEPAGRTEQIKEATSGILRIQDWNPGGIVSGRIEAEFTTNFYVDMSQPVKD